MSENENKVDSELDAVALKQLVWKSPSCARIAVRICNRALSNPVFFPDEIDNEDIPTADMNCIGSMFRFLAGKKSNIIQRTETFKRSEAKGRRGSTVFGYSLRSRALAEALVRRLGAQAESPQKEFAL